MKAECLFIPFIKLTNSTVPVKHNSKKYLNKSMNNKILFDYSFSP